MPRNPDGSVTKPSGNPVITGTAINSTVHNTTTSDIYEILEDSLSRSGNGGMLSPMEFDDGTVTDPGITFGSEPTSGIYRAAAGQAGFSVLGVLRSLWTAAGLAVKGALDLTGSLVFSDSGAQSITKTAGDLTVTVAGATTVASTGDLTLGSTGDVYLSAGGVQIAKADASFSAFNVLNNPITNAAYVRLKYQTADPTTPSGAIWYRADTGVYKARVNSVNYDLVTSQWDSALVTSIHADVDPTVAAGLYVERNLALGLATFRCAQLRAGTGLSIPDGSTLGYVPAGYRPNGTEDLLLCLSHGTENYAQALTINPSTGQVILQLSGNVTDTFTVGLTGLFWRIS